MRQKVTGSRWVGRFRDAWPAVLAIAALWLVRYARSGEFGLYEDDLTHIPSAVQMTPSELAEFTLETFQQLRGQGTPLKLTLWYWLANLGWRIGELRGLYVLGFTIIASNVVLFYSFARRLGDKAFAACAVLAYVLYSADTTQAFVSHSFILQTSIAMLLMALLCYQRRWKVVSYVLMALALLTYETTYLVFLAAPLLAEGWNGEWRRRLGRHILITVGILAAVVLARAAIGEGRVLGLAPIDIALVPLTHVSVGPLVALATYIYRPLQAILSLRPDVLLVSALGAGVLGVWLWSMAATTLHSRAQGADARSGPGAGPFEFRWPRWLPIALRHDLRLFLIGLLMLVLAYPLTFTVRPYAISGRDTRVHAAGVVGASVLVGSAMVMSIGWAEARGRRAWAVAALAAVFGLLAGYGFVIQNDYARAWSLQKSFWSQLVRLIPDVGDGSVILVDPSGLEDARQIGANYWNMPRVLGQLYRFPSSWESQPRVFRLAEGWETRIWTGDGRVRLDAATTIAPASTYRVVDPDSMILVRVQNGLVERYAGPFPSGGGAYQLPPAPAPGEPAYPHGFLYDLMVATGYEVSVSSAMPWRGAELVAVGEAIRP